MKQRITLLLVLASVVASIAQPSLSNTSKWSVYDGNNNWITTGALFKQYCLGVSDLSVWTGSSSITTVGTISSGTWNGTNIALNKIAQGGATTGQVLEWNGSAWAPGTDDTGGGGGVSGTDQQTTRFNGTTLEASSQILNSGTAVGIGGTPPTGGVELKVYGATETTGSYISTGSGDLLGTAASSATRYLNTATGNQWTIGHRDNGKFTTYIENLPTNWIDDASGETFDLYPKRIGLYQKTIATSLLAVVDSSATDAVAVVENKLSGSAELELKAVSTGDTKLTMNHVSRNFGMGIDASTTNKEFVMGFSQTLGVSRFKSFDVQNVTETSDYAPIETRTTSLSGSTTLTNADYQVICTGTGFTVTLPATIVVGKRYKIFNSTIGNIVINANGKTINGSASITMPAAFANEVPSLSIVGISTIAWAIEGFENLPNSVRAADIAAEGAEGTGIQIVSGTPAWVNQERYVTTGALVINATVAYADVTGLQFDVNNGDIYEFEALITYNVNATTTGTTWAINGPAGTVVYRTDSFTGAAAQDIRMKTALDAVSTSSSSANVNGNLATIKGIVKPSANGTYKIRFASEVAVANAVIVQVGSVLKFRKIN